MRMLGGGSRVIALIYLGVGLAIAGLGFGSLALLRKVGKPHIEAEAAVAERGAVLVFFGVVLLWPALIAIVWKESRR